MLIALGHNTSSRPRSHSVSEASHSTQHWHSSEVNRAHPQDLRYLCYTTVYSLFPTDYTWAALAGWYVTKLWNTNTRAMEHLGLHIPHSMQLLHTIPCETPLFVHSCISCTHHNGMGDGTPNRSYCDYIHTQGGGSKFKLLPGFPQENLLCNV